MTTIEITRYFIGFFESDSQDDVDDVAAVPTDWFLESSG